MTPYGGGEAGRAELGPPYLGYEVQSVPKRLR